MKTVKLVENTWKKTENGRKRLGTVEIGYKWLKRCKLLKTVKMVEAVENMKTAENVENSSKRLK